MIGMDQYEMIRTASRVYHKSIRQIVRETKHSRKTVRKALRAMEPQYRQQRTFGSKELLGQTFPFSNCRLR